jgi:threonine dehydrogenase-like Zn-dependent dehydrogenase
MRAAVFKQAGQPWVVEERPVPVPGTGEMVVKVGRCGICGTDLNMTSGNGYDFPCDSVLGHEFSGEIVELGQHVTGFQIGEIVAALPATGCGDCAICRDGLEVLCPQMKPYSSGYAQYALVAARTAVKLPQSLSLADGALVEPLSVGLHGVNLAHMPKGARVLVLGAGAVGLATTYWARQLGAGCVVTASRSARREEKAMILGAHHYVQTGTDEAERINAALGGLPDIVFETAGVVGMLGQSLNLVRPNGHVVSMGFCMAPDPLVPGIATCKQARITFSMAWTLAEFQQSVDALDAGHVEPRDMVTNTITLDALPAKIDEMRQPHNETKVHVAPNG